MQNTIESSSAGHSSSAEAFTYAQALQKVSGVRAPELGADLLASQRNLVGDLTKTIHSETQGDQHKLTESLTQLKGQRSELQQVINDTKGTVSATTQQQNSAQLNELNQMIDELQRQLEMVTNQRDAALKQIQLNDHLKSLSSGITQLQKQKNLTKISLLKGDVTRLKYETTVGKLALSAKDDKIKALTEESSKVKTTAEDEQKKLAEANEELLKRVADLEAENAQSKDVEGLKALKASNDELLEKLNGLQKKANQDDTTIAQLQTQAEDLSTELEDTIIEKNTYIRELQANLDSTATKLNAARNEITNLEKSLSDERVGRKSDKDDFGRVYISAFPTAALQHGEVEDFAEVVSMLKEHADTAFQMLMGIENDDQASLSDAQRVYIDPIATFIGTAAAAFEDYQESQALRKVKVGNTSNSNSFSTSPVSKKSSPVIATSSSNAGVTEPKSKLKKELLAVRKEASELRAELEKLKLTNTSLESAAIQELNALKNRTSGMLSQQKTFAQTLNDKLSLKLALMDSTVDGLKEFVKEVQQNPNMQSNEVLQQFTQQILDLLNKDTSVV